jgi:hypothetical protein
VHDAAEAVMVVDRIVQCAVVVPERQRADALVEAVGKFGPGLVLEQKVQERRAPRRHAILRRIAAREHPRFTFWNGLADDGIGAACHGERLAAVL